MTDLVQTGWSGEQADCRRVFEDNAHPMWILEAERIVAVNRAAVRHYGYSRAELLAATTAELEVADGRAGVASAALAPGPAMTRAEPRSRIARHRKKDGSLVDVELTSFPITFAGRPASLVSVLDVT